jgi:uncharacterized membrane protein YdbT with pleckstrin-like domain
MALAGTFCFVGFVALAVGLILRHNDLAPQDAARVVLGGVLVALLSLVPAWLRWRSAEFALTDRRVLATTRTTLLLRRSVDVPVDRLSAVDVDESMLGRFLGYGTVRLETAGQRTEAFGHVASARDFCQAAGKHLPTASSRTG